MTCKHSRTIPNRKKKEDNMYHFFNEDIERKNRKTSKMKFFCAIYSKDKKNALLNP